MPFAGQKDYQQQLVINQLYAVAALGGSEQLQPSIEVIGGTVDIYGSELHPSSAPTGMFKTKTAFSGIEAFAVIPNYIFINGGTPTSIITSGLSVTAVA